MTVEVLAWVLGVAGVLLVLLLSIIGWFLRSMAKSFEKATRTIGEHTTILAVHTAKLDDLQLLKLRYEDLSGFLQRQGFKRADG